MIPMITTHANAQRSIHLCAERWPRASRHQGQRRLSTRWRPLDGGVLWGAEPKAGTVLAGSALADSGGHRRLRVTREASGARSLSAATTHEMWMRPRSPYIISLRTSRSTARARARSSRTAIPRSPGGLRKDEATFAISIPLGRTAWRDGKGLKSSTPKYA